MNSLDHHTPEIFGIPLFGLALGTLLLAALAGLILGIWKWKKPWGKVMVGSSVLVLLGFALVIVLVLLTVSSGSMG